MENNEDNRQMTEEKIWKVYLLPHANYCGVSSNLHKRLIQHRSRHKRNTDDFIILAEFNDKRLALDFETSYQLEHNCNGYPFPPERREKISENTRQFGEERIYKKTRVPVRCIESGELNMGWYNHQFKTWQVHGRIGNIRVTEWFDLPLPTKP